MIEDYSKKRFNPLSSIIHLTNQGFILGEDFELGEKGELIVFPQTHQKVSNKILEYQQRLFSNNKNKNQNQNKNKNKNKNAPISPVLMEKILEGISMSACGNPKYIDNVLDRLANQVESQSVQLIYFYLCYSEIFIEGTENKLPELKEIDLRGFTLDQIFSESEKTEILINLDKYPIPPVNIQNEVIENVLMDIASSFSLTLEDEVINSIGISLMPINAFRFIDKVWTSEKVHIKKIIEFMEKSSIK